MKPLTLRRKLAAHAVLPAVTPKAEFVPLREIPVGGRFQFIHDTYVRVSETVAENESGEYNLISIDAATLNIYVTPLPALTVAKPEPGQRMQIKDVPVKFRFTHMGTDFTKMSDITIKQDLTGRRINVDHMLGELFATML